MGDQVVITVPPIALYGIKGLRGFMVVYRGILGEEEIVIGKKVFCYSAEAHGRLGGGEGAELVCDCIHEEGCSYEDYYNYYGNLFSS